MSTLGRLMSSLSAYISHLLKPSQTPQYGIENFVDLIGANGELDCALLLPQPLILKLVKRYVWHRTELGFFGVHNKLLLIT